LAGAALHGLLYDLPFEVINELCDDHHATVTLFFNYEGYYEGYPFHYEIRIVYTLKPGAQLTLSTDLVNRSDYPIPMMDGWHPYFHLGGSVNNLELKVATVNKIELNDKLVPSGVTTVFNEFMDWSQIGDRHFDDCYELDEPNHGYVLCSLRNPQNGWQIDLEPDYFYPYLQIYTPPDRKSISLENISAVPNAFCNGLGLKRLQPREHYRLNTTITVSKK
jgi:aldose 1-epimerase